MVSSNHSVQSSIGGDSDKSITGNTLSSGDLSNLSNCTIFVGDLSIFVTEGDLVLAFQTFGNILDAKIMRCEETHKNLSYGFVKFDEPAAAVTAMEELNGKLLCGRPMRISWASHKTKKVSADLPFGGSFMNKQAKPFMNQHNRESNYSIDSASIHVTFTSEQVNYYIDEEVLRAVFETFGEVVDITIKKYDFDPINGNQRGYGFIHFPSTDEGIEAALGCTEELRNTLIGEARYKCDVSHKLMKELYDRKHPSISALMQRYPSFLKVIQAREGNKNRQLKQGGGVMSNQYANSYVQSKHAHWNTSLLPIATGVFPSMQHSQYVPYSIAAPTNSFPLFPSVSQSDAANSGSKSSSQDSGGSMVGYFAVNSFYHGGHVPLIPTPSGQHGNDFFTGNLLTSNVDSFAVDDISMHDYTKEYEDRARNLTIEVDSKHQSAESERDKSMNINKQHNGVHSQSTKDGAGWNAVVAAAATPFHNHQNAKHNVSSSDTSEGGHSSSKDRMYAIASPTWFHPWNHVIYPYSSYASSPPFSPAPFGFSPMPMIPSPSINYVSVGKSLNQNSSSGNHAGIGQNNSGRRNSKISRFSFSETKDPL